MFIGEYHHTVDGKGRVALPTKFRSVLSQGIVVTRGIDRCLFVYPNEVWKTLAAKVAALPMNQKNNRAFARLILAGAMDASLDAQGRVLLPDYLRGYAELGKDVVIAGVHDRLEIWGAGEWERYTREAERQSEDIAERVEFFHNDTSSQ